MSTDRVKAVPLIAQSANAQKPYPRHLVILGLLAFCLSVWAMVIFAVTRLG